MQLGVTSSTQRNMDVTQRKRHPIVVNVGDPDFSDSVDVLRIGLVAEYSTGVSGSIWHSLVTIGDNSVRESLVDLQFFDTS